MASKDLSMGMTHVTGLIGLSFWQAWWMLAMCTGILLPRSTTLPVFQNASVTVLVTTLLAYIVVAILGANSGPLTDKPSLSILVPVLCVCGSLGMSLAAHTAPLFEIADNLFVVSLLMFSLGNAALLVMWGELWSTLATGLAGRQIYLSYTVAFVIFFTIRAMPLLLGILMTSFLPMVSILMWRSAQAEPRRSDPQRPQGQRGHLPVIRALSMVFVANFVWGISQSFLGSLPDKSDPTTPAFLFAGVGLAVIAILYIVLKPSTPEPVLLYRPIVPAICGGLILIVALPQNLLFIGDGLLVTGGYCLDIIVLLVASDLAFWYRKPVAVTLGISIIVTRIGSLAGTVAGHLIPANSVSDIHGILLLCAFALLLIGTFLFNSDHLILMYRAHLSLPLNESLDAKCQQISNLYRLTPRESEIFALLAHGRSAPYIADELSIAVGTTKNHVSNIYRKIGVYDRQSLHNLVEQQDISS